MIIIKTTKKQYFIETSLEFIINVLDDSKLYNTYIIVKDNIKNKEKEKEEEKVKEEKDKEEKDKEKIIINTNCEIIIQNYCGKTWYKNAQIHRIDGPAVITEDEQCWYKDGLKHRIDGPAVINNDEEEWYMEGKRL